MKKTNALLLLLFPFLLAQAQFSNMESRGPGGGGALFSPSINPDYPAEFYIACDMGELFHTIDGGGYYFQEHYQSFVGGHNSRIAFTNVPGRRYGISYPNEIGTPVVSLDFGATWNTLSGNPDPNEEVYSLYVDYADPSRMILSHYTEIFFSTDAGTSFNSIHTASQTSLGVVVGGVHWDGSNIYLGTSDGLLRSTDNGATWVTNPYNGITTGNVIWSFAGSTSAQGTRLVCITADMNDVYVGRPGSDYWGFWKGIYVLDPGSSTWTNRSAGLDINNDFPMFVDMAAIDIHTIWLAGSSGASEPNLIRSTDGGLTWNHTFLTTNNQNIITGWSGQGGDRGWSYGECVFGFDVNYSNPDHVVFGDYGFVHLTTNGGATWRQAYTDPPATHSAGSPTPTGQSYGSKGIENTTCWQVHWTSPNTMWACYSDIRGCRSTDGGWTWGFGYTGHTANTSYRVANGPNGWILAATSNIHDIYQSTRLTDAHLDAADPNGKIIYSSDQGQTWQDLHTFGHPVFWIVVDPNNPNRGYASVIHYDNGGGFGGVYRCDDLNLGAASTWTQLPDPPRTEKHPACLEVLNDGTLLATYSGRRTNVGAFTPSSGVFTYDPGTGQWADRSDPGMHYWTKDIVIDPKDPTQSTWMVGVFSGWGGPPNGLGGLYRTSDRGQTWDRISQTTLDRVTSCTFNPQSCTWYVTTEGQGLWELFNDGGAAPMFQHIETYPFQQPERVFPDPNNPQRFWITSFGNGMKVGTLMASNELGFGQAPAIRVAPNPSNGPVEIHRTSAAQEGPLEVLDLQGKVLRRIDDLNPVLHLDLSDLPAGTYVLRQGPHAAKLIHQ